ncbi:hypothetical protein Ahy_A02g009213 isoform A [Arachis hypogaea]|uniref:Small ribosomal subunit protein uS2 n=1 Tax=Arachis hypogaea TaxID=3818 RepID=A0A445EGD3_ARAHY|nr:hypothetical protein Ahy_A02g009213 isoform A [Arachis hypogaea]
MATSAAAPRQLSQKEQDIQMMLAAEVHLGTKNCDFQMERYVFKRRNDGIYIINLGKTWEKLQLAARIIVAIENPQDIIVQSARPYGQRAVLKFAQYTGANAIAGRHTPGTFTNQMQTSYNEPRLLILTDPRTDHQPIKEGALGNIPTIAFCDTDSPMRYVDVGIPANNKGKHSIGCLFWLLARMVLQMRGIIRPGLKWDVMVDLFFYREPEEAKQQEEEEAPAAPEYAIQDFGAAGIAGFPTADGEWTAVTVQPWPEEVPQPPIAAAPADWAPDTSAGDWEPVPAPQPSVPAPGAVAPTAEREFRVEVEAIGRVRHKNLVRLLGYCVEGAYRMLMYEYVDNGNLDQWLHGDVDSVSPLTWDIRMNIILGMAKGLAYLHEGLEPKVVHRDVKSSNILLDRQWNPKVSDFGLAKLLCSDHSYVTTRVMGTFGYVAPEYACTRMLTEKSDVYSFGILIMEIITGRSPADYSKPQGEVNLIEWLKTMVGNRKSEELIDPNLPEKPSSKALKLALLVALKCVDPDATKRPKIGHIIHMLEADEILFRDRNRRSASSKP